MMCPEHGQVQQVGQRTPRAEKRVFLSYGRADALDFTRRLASDLQERGYFTWFDIDDIEKGGLFEVRIEQGIRKAHVLAAVMTPASVREQSVCRDEVVYALNESKLVVPLKAHKDVKPTLLLARRNWIDFTAGYDQGLDALLRFLDGDEGALLLPRLPTVTGVVPLDFGPELARYSAGFTGRAWLAEEIDRWLARGAQRAMVIIGEPGIGKSAITAWLGLTRPEVAAVHFCTDRNTRSLDPFEFVASLVGQLHASVPGYAEAVEAKDPARRRPKASDAFRELIVEPASGIPSPPQTRIILVDSLDEASGQQGETVVDVVVQQAPDLPAWLRIITTTRPEQPIMERVRVLWAFELNADRPENRRDVRAYIDARLNAGPNANQADRLDELAAANFLYARMVLDALEDGSLSAQDLGALSPGLSAFYSKTLIKRFPDPEVFAKESLVILRALSVAMGPVPFAFLDYVSRQPKESLEVTNRRLMALRPYLRVSGKGESAAYSLYHKALAEWLNDRDAAGTYWCQGGMGHADLARACWFDYENGVEQMTEYSLRYAIHHLHAAGRETDVRTLNKNTVFRNRRLALGIDAWAAIHASVESLPAEVRQRFMELAEFPPYQPIPETAIGMLWAHTGRLSDLETHELLVTLSVKSLVQFVTQPSDAGQASRQVRLHYLVHDYIRRRGVWLA